MYRIFEGGACRKDHDAARRDHDSFAGAWIPSRTRGLTSHGEPAKFGDDDGLPPLQGGLEEIQNPVQQRDRLSFCDPQLSNDSLGDIQLVHQVSISPSAGGPYSTDSPGIFPSIMRTP